MPPPDLGASSYKIEPYDENSVRMVFSHRVGRSLCMLVCTGLALFLVAVGFATAYSETRDPCLIVVETRPPSPPPFNLFDMGDGDLNCEEPPLQVVHPTCVRNATTVATDECEAFAAGMSEDQCPETCNYEDPDDLSGRGFIVFSQQPIATRLTASSDSGPSNFICVGWNGDSWQTLLASATTETFTPRASDVMVASYSASDYAIAVGVREYVGGTEESDRHMLGYAHGDLVVTATEVPRFNLNGSYIVAFPPAVEPAPPPPPCHAVPPGGASSPGWFAFGGAILLMAMGIGGLRGGCKYEEVALDKSQGNVVITITRRACMCIDALRCQKCILRETVHELPPDVEAAQCDYEADSGVCSGALRHGKSVVVAPNSSVQNSDGTVTQGFIFDKSVQVWNGTPLSMSDSNRLQKQINTFLDPNYKDDRKPITFDGPEWHQGTPKRPEDGGSPEWRHDSGNTLSTPRRPRAPTRSVSSFGTHLRQPPRLPAEAREQRQKSLQQVRIADNDASLGDLQRAQKVRKELTVVRSSLEDTGRMIPAELDMLLSNLDDEIKLQQSTTELRLYGSEMPLERSNSAHSAPGPPAEDAPSFPRPQPLSQTSGTSTSVRSSRAIGDDNAEDSVDALDIKWRPSSAAVSHAEASTAMELVERPHRDGQAERNDEADGAAASTARAQQGQGNDPPQDGDEHDSFADGDQGEQEQTQLLEPPALTRSVAVEELARTAASTTEASAKEKLKGASMLARLSAFKAQKAAAASVADSSAVLQPEDDDHNNEQSLATPIPGDTDAATQPLSVPIGDAGIGAAVDSGEKQIRTEKPGEEEVATADGSDQTLEATTADDSGTPIRVTTPPRRGHGAGSKGNTAQSSKRAEVVKKRLAEKKKAKAAAAAAEVEAPKQEGSHLPSGSDTDGSPNSAPTDAAEKGREKKAAEGAEQGTQKARDILAAKRAARKAAAQRSKSKRSGTTASNVKADEIKARIEASKAVRASKTKGEAAQAKPEA